MTPQARYYIGSFDGTGSTGNRVEEIVFIGTVPEPTSMALLAMGLLGFAARRRRA